MVDDHKDVVIAILVLWERFEIEEDVLPCLFPSVFSRLLLGEDVCNLVGPARLPGVQQPFGGEAFKSSVVRDCKKGCALQADK